ncbi:hypothetical protein BTO30_10165 [Domibacillus antri]|uniref:Uncharacterized protein n=1 Tax=Domibacillus antri TaxID=1714264 RepID=A0A1Q8Q4M5_9BACI|nr:hypothetical protein BTO30_10165 [Domibacillus antri]
MDNRFYDEEIEKAMIPLKAAAAKWWLFQCCYRVYKGTKHWEKMPNAHFFCFLNYHGEQYHK